MGLSLKFGAKGLRLLPTIRSLDDLDRLEMVKESIKVTDDLREIEALFKE